MIEKKQRRDFPGRRALTILLRSAHLVGVVMVGAALFGGTADRASAAAIMLVTGLAMFALDVWSDPTHLGELAGVFIPLKLLLVAWIALDPERAALIFWFLIVASSIVSHAPGKFRHIRIFGR